MVVLKSGPHKGPGRITTAQRRMPGAGMVIHQSQEDQDPKLGLHQNPSGREQSPDRAMEPFRHREAPWGLVRTDSRCAGELGSKGLFPGP